MSLNDCLDACRQVSALVSGIVTSNLNTPEAEPTEAMFPMTVTRFDLEQEGIITLGGLLQRVHPIEQVLLVRRLGDRAGESAEVQPFLELLIDQYLGHVNLFGTNRTVINDIRYKVGPFTFFNVDYWGASLHLQVEELVEVASLIHA